MGCKDLQYIRMGKNVTSIGEGSLDGYYYDRLILAPSGSYAESYAKEHNIRVTRTK